MWHSIVTHFCSKLDHQENSLAFEIPNWPIHHKRCFWAIQNADFSFFHFSRNSLPQVHVFFRAQEKISSLRKKSSSHFLVLKTHATPISAHFEQNTPKNVRKKISLGKFFSQNFLDGLRGQKNTKKIWEKNFPRERNGKWTSLGKIFSHFFP